MSPLHHLLFILLFALTSGQALAQESVLVSCDGAPSDAVLQLPEPLNRWGQIYCTKYGHSLAAKERWIWSFPGAFAPVHLPAQMVRDQPKELGHKAYFKQLEFVPLSGTAAEDAVQKINGTSMRPDSAVATTFRLTLTNQSGQSHTVLFVQTINEVQAGKGLWGFWCNTGCTDGMPFMLLNYEGPKK